MTDREESNADNGVGLPSRTSFLEMMGGDEEMCAEILVSALEDGEMLRKEIVAAVLAGDCDRARGSLHALRGGVSTLEADGIVDRIREMEADAKAENDEALRGHLDAFNAGMESYRRALGDLLGEFS